MYFREPLSYIVIYFFSLGLILPDVEANSTYQLGYLSTSDLPRNLTSPNFPDPYPSNTWHIWWIYSRYLDSNYYIQITFLDIEDSNNCENDNLTIYQYHNGFERIVTVCGNTSTEERFELGSDVIVSFRTNNNTEGKGFVLQYYALENDDSQEGNEYHTRGYSSNWGTAMIVIFALTLTVLIGSVAVACYCQRKHRKDNVQNIEFSDKVVAEDKTNAYI